MVESYLSSGKVDLKRHRTTTLTYYRRGNVMKLVSCMLVLMKLARNNLDRNASCSGPAEDSEFFALLLLPCARAKILGRVGIIRSLQ